MIFENILFPVDFSSSSVAVAPYVKRAAAILNSRVTLVHVADLASHNGFELYVRSLQEVADEHWDIGRRKIDSFLEVEFPITECPRILRSGEAAAQIADVARTGAFDLIIMPTHAGRFRQMLLGSTTAKVLNDADCPVLTTEHAESIIPRPLEHREWVCAIGLSADSERVLGLACRAAEQTGANLSVIHVIRSQHSAFADSREEEEARRRLEELQKAAGCVTAVSVVAGPVKKALIETAQRYAADALIIGRTPASGALGRIRDLTYSLVRDSPFPVLSV